MKLTHAIYAVICIALILLACSKSDTNPGDTTKPPPEQINDTINHISLGSIDSMGLDTTNNYISSYSFSKKTAPGQPTGYYKELGNYVTRDKGIYTIKYLPNIGISNVDSNIRRSGSQALFALADSLRNKPLFEVYKDTTLVKRFIAASDSITIGMYYLLVIDDTIPTKKVGEKFNDLVRLKQSDKLRYDKYK